LRRILLARRKGIDFAPGKDWTRRWMESGLAGDLKNGRIAHGRVGLFYKRGIAESRDFVQVIDIT